MTERSVADWEELREIRAEQARQMKAATEKQAMISMGMKMKRYKDALKTKKLGEWC